MGILKGFNCTCNKCMYFFNGIMVAMFKRETWRSLKNCLCCHRNMSVGNRQTMKESSCMIMIIHSMNRDQVLWHRARCTSCNSLQYSIFLLNVVGFFCFLMWLLLVILYGHWSPRESIHNYWFVWAGLLHAGDRIIEVNGFPVDGLEPEQVIQVVVGASISCTVHQSYAVVLWVAIFSHVSLLL